MLLLTLYSLYTNDIPNKHPTNVALYADDTCIYVTHKRHDRITLHPQNAIDVLEDWLIKWKIKTNPNKTQAILYTQKRHPPNGNVTHYGEEIEWQDDVKYLGVTLDKRLTWSKHVENSVQKAKSKQKLLSPLLNPSCKLNISLKLKIYKSLIQPILTYAPSPWCFAADTHLNKLEVTQNKIMRLITGAPWFVRNIELRQDLQLKPIKDVTKQQATNTYKKASTHTNLLVSQIPDYDPNNIIRHRRPKQGMTHN